MVLSEKAINLLKRLIETPSPSGQEQDTADLLMQFLESEGVSTQRLGNNVWAANKHFDAQKPTILLHSHHDTVKPNAGYTKNPFSAIEEEGRLYGLGSNDAGGSLVCLIAAFLHFYRGANLTHNLVLAAGAEEETSGKDGIEALIPELPAIDFAIVGEPTRMQMAVAEKGLMVLDCVARGKSGHAARNEGENALYKAIQSIEWFRTYEFEKTSDSLGPVKMSVTVIEAGRQHNVVPDACHFVVDVRTTDAYSNEETLAIIRREAGCEVSPRSVRLNPSGIAPDHPAVRAGLALGREAYGSPTLSDQALMPFPSLKMGPGDSARSHTADEYICLTEIKEGIDLYIELIKRLIN